jgi:pilus assembly protein Flp/PilA
VHRLPGRAWLADFSTFCMKEITPMGVLMSQMRQFLSSEDGPTAVEYAVMLALILVACITIVTSLGSNISGTFSSVSSTLSGS